MLPIFLTQYSEARAQEDELNSIEEITLATTIATDDHVVLRTAEQEGQNKECIVCPIDQNIERVDQNNRIRSTIKGCSKNRDVEQESKKPNRRLIIRRQRLKNISILVGT